MGADPTQSIGELIREEMQHGKERVFYFLFFFFFFLLLAKKDSLGV